MATTQTTPPLGTPRPLLSRKFPLRPHTSASKAAQTVLPLRSLREGRLSPDKAAAYTSPMDKERPAPDWSRLQELVREMERIQAEGRWTCEAFHRILGEGERAAAGRQDLLDFIYVHASRYWFDID